jgi:hypothetical protein
MGDGGLPKKTFILPCITADSKRPFLQTIAKIKEAMGKLVVFKSSFQNLTIPFVPLT